MRRIIGLAALFCLMISTIGVFAAEKDFHGYLSDAKCGPAGKDGNGVDLTKTPEKHTVACMKMEACAASGYGMFIKDEKGNYVFHKFDKAGSEMAKKHLATTKLTDNVMVKVKGEMEKDASIKVKGLEIVKK